MLVERIAATAEYAYMLRASRRAMEMWWAKRVRSADPTEGPSAAKWANTM